MRKKSLLFILSFLALSINILAQRVVKITVREAGTQQLLVGAKVSFSPNKAHTDTLIAITNNDGKAIINLEKEHTLYYYRVSLMGYIPTSGTLSTTEQDLNITLKEDVMHLNGVVVTGSRTERPIKLSPITTQVLGGKALVDAGYSDLQHALQQETPGMNIQKVGFGNEISMQGLDARHVLFLQDGERMTGDMAGNLDYERF